VKLFPTPNPLCLSRCLLSKRLHWCPFNCTKANFVASWTLRAFWTTKNDHTGN